MESAGGRESNMGGGWGSPGNPSGITGDDPDWAAMAAANERDVRRKRQLRIVIGAVSAFAVTGIVVVAVAAQGSGGQKPSADQPAAAAPASPTAPGPASASASGSAPPSGSDWGRW